MNCQSCGRALVPGASFCPSCGTPVGDRCRNCGSPLPAGARFCPACGEPVPGAAAGDDRLDAPTRLGRERKVATVVFADIVGYTALNEKLDPEIVQGLTAATFERLAQEANRYEGLLEKFAGDSVMVLFGVPQLHEDDAERAVRAAFEMQAAMARPFAPRDGGPGSAGGPQLRLRIGIESGEVLVDQGRVATTRERMVTGDAVNMAARLQAVAEPGQIVVGPATYSASRSVIEYEELGSRAVKGKSQPVPAWRAVSVRARRGGLRSPMGIESALVGRDAEMSVMKETVRRVAKDGRPYLLTMIGAAGVGKSRLAWELEKYLDGLPEIYLWRKGRSFAYAQTSLGALVELLRSDTGILEDDSPDTALQKLENRLNELPRPVPESERGLLRGLLGLREMPKVPPDELFGSITHYVEALARIAPTVLVFEDVHWADESLLDFIESVASWSTGPIMLLCLARHEFLERRPTWAGGIRNSTTVVIEPLDATANARLIDGLAPGGIPEQLRERIVELADGNPLFTEELVRMFIDRGVLRFASGQWELADSVDALDVPRSVQAVLAARIDALPVPERVVAQDAAVVGRIFWDAVVAELAHAPRPRVEDLLRRLRVKELVVPREPSSFMDADEFTFRHAIVRDVAYESLPKLDRADKHLAVAAWAQRDVGERSGEAAELVAGHYLAALRYREEFGAPPEDLRRLREMAYAWVVMARDRSALLHEKAGATRWARICLDLAQVLEMDAVEQARAAAAYLKVGSGHWQRDEAAEVGRRALGLLETATEHTDEREGIEAEIRTGLAWILLGQGRAEEARTGLESQLERLTDPAPSQVRAWLLARIGWLAWRVGPAESARPYLERALAEARSTGSRRVEAWALHELGVVAGQSGDAEHAADLIRQSLEIARQLGDHDLTVRCYVNLPAMTIDNAPDWDELERYLAEGLALVRRASNREAEGWVLWQMSDIAEFRGEIAKCVELRRQAVEIAERHGDRVTAAVRLVGQQWMEAHLGKWPDDIGANATEAGLLIEEQYQAWAITWNALLAWHRDPAAGISAFERDLAPMDNEYRTATLWAARMAYRAGTASLMQVALKKAGGPGFVSELIGDWVVALAGDRVLLPAKLAEFASKWEQRGFLNYAEMARVDLALATARAGRDPSHAVREVLAFQAKLGIRPVLGPIPETRWLEAQPTIDGVTADTAAD